MASDATGRCDCGGVRSTGLTTTEAWWVAEAGDYHVRPSGLVEYDFEG